MFTIYKNNYNRNGVCLYRNHRGDEAFFKRTEEGFTSKLRLVDEGVKLATLHVSIPIDDKQNGASLNIDYPSLFDVGSISDILEEYSGLVNRWIMMCYDLETMQAVQKLNQPITECINDLKKYDELNEILQQFFD